MLHYWSDANILLNSIWYKIKRTKVFNKKKHLQCEGARRGCFKSLTLCALSSTDGQRGGLKFQYKINASVWVLQVFWPKTAKTQIHARRRRFSSLGVYYAAWMFDALKRRFSCEIIYLRALCAHRKKKSAAPQHLAAVMSRPCVRILTQNTMGRGA